jgi:hypothetical protein
MHLAVPPWLRRRSALLARDPVLGRYGAVLAALQLLTLAWLVQRHAWQALALGSEVICWPMLPGCGALRVLLPWQVGVWLGAIGLCAAGSFALFLRRHAAAPLFLLAGEVLLLALLAQDLRLRRNQHYLLAFTTLAYLFVPGTLRALRGLLVLFYFWAGTLKLNEEWLSGAALYGPVPFTGLVLRAGCAWVVVLELVLVWGLLSQRRWLFWVTLLQLALFEVASAPIVGFFYPLLMAGLLTLFWLSRPGREAPQDAPGAEGRGAGPGLDLVAPRTVPAGAWALWLAFSLLQAVPRLFPGDTAITGEGRLFALHMFDAKVECASRATLRNGGQAVQVFDLSQGLAVRVACDPLVARARALSLCGRIARMGGEGLRLDLSLRSKRSSEPALREVVAIDDFCRHVPAYRWWRHNDWIAAGP